MKIIPLTRGKVAIVDDEDYEELAKYRWHFTQDGYAMRETCDYINGKRTNRRRIRMHVLVNETPPDKVTDHINCDKLDNRRVNLRTATRAENNRNVGMYAHNTSGYKGVSWSPQCKGWRVRITVNNKPIYLHKTFSDPIAAARAYDRLAKKHYGDFAHPNFK